MCIRFCNRAWTRRIRSNPDRCSWIQIRRLNTPDSNSLEHPNRSKLILQRNQVGRMSWFLGTCPSLFLMNSHTTAWKKHATTQWVSIILSKGEIRVYFNGGNQSLNCKEQGIC